MNSLIVSLGRFSAACCARRFQISKSPSSADTRLPKKSRYLLRHGFRLLDTRQMRCIFNERKAGAWDRPIRGVTMS
jgi:hypothetical protein